MRRLAVFVPVCALACPAAAQVIDFQSLEAIDANIHRVAFSYSEDGFTLNAISPQFFLGYFGTLWRQYPGSTALFKDTPNGITQLVKADGDPFDLDSIDLAPFNNEFAPVGVTFTGTTADGGAVVQSFATSGIGFVLETFTFSDEFDHVVEVRWVQASPFHQFDNITIIPAPGAACLLAFAVLARARRR